MPQDPKAKADGIAWLPWPGTFDVPGHFFASDLEDVRKQFLRSGRSPKVTMASATEISRLTYVITAKDKNHEKDNEASSEEEDESDKEKVVIHRWHQYAEEMQEFCKAIGIEYYGESLASFTLRVLILHLKMKRRTLPDSEKEKIKAEQDGRCGMCGGIVDKGDEEFDHVSPLRDLCSKKQEKLQLLCSACHAEKTAEEPRCDRDPLRSAFNQTAYESYVLSPRAPQLQFNAFSPQQFAGKC